MKLDPVFVTTGPMKYKCCCHIKLESIGTLLVLIPVCMRLHQT
jgi:hypothetical protein